MTDGSPTGADFQPISIDLAREGAFEVGALTVRPAVREIVAGEAREILEPRVMQALVALARRRGEVVSRDELIATCWDGRVVGDDAINGCVAKVRRLGEAHGAFSIETIPRVGYRLNANGSAAPAPATPVQRQAPAWAWIVAAALVLATLAGLSVWRMQGAPAVRVAVLPFEAAVTDKALASRVRDSVASVLSARLIDVASKDETKGVRLVIGGAVERSGGLAHVRVTVDDNRTGLTLWRGQFSAPDAPDSPIAERAAARTGDLVYNAVKLLQSSKGSASPDAMKAFMVGLERWRDGRQAESVSFFRVFRDKAPDLPMSHGVYSLALIQAAYGQGPELRAAWRREAGQEADRALAMDPGESSAVRTKYSLIPSREFAAQEALLNEGLKRSPDDPGLVMNEGLLLGNLGRPQEGIKFLRRGLALDPLSSLKNFGITSDLGMLGLTDEARSMLAASERIWPESRAVFEFYTMFAADFAQPDEGLAIIETLRARDPAYEPQARIWRQYLESLKCECGQEAAAQVLRQAMLADQVDQSIAFPALVRLGRVDDAYTMLKARPQSGRTDRMLFAQVTAPMRRETRFMDLAAEKGLAQYWLKSGRWPEFCAEPGLSYDCKVEAARAAAQRGLAPPSAAAAPAS